MILVQTGYQCLTLHLACLTDGGGKCCSYSATRTLQSESAVTTESPADRGSFSWQASVYGNRHTRSSYVSNRERDGFAYGFVTQSVKLMKGTKNQVAICSSSRKPQANILGTGAAPQAVSISSTLHFLPRASELFILEA